VANDVELLILQHPKEVHHAKNSAPLLRLGLRHCRVWVGEYFDQAVLQPPHAAPKHSVLLYPRASSYGATTHGPAQDTWAHTECSHLRLIVLDGTWRNSRSLLHRNPWLQALPRFSLDDAPASRYLIRKAHQPGQLCTLEASCLALGQLEGDPAKYQPMLEGFDGFVAQQLAYSPADRAPRRPVMNED